MQEQAHPEKLGRYEIVRKLGEGAMGVVYEGRDPKLGRRVAIKTARRELMADGAMADELMQRFLREAQAAGILNHPNIVTIYDVGEEGNMAYIAMEYLEGADLRDSIAARQRLSIEEIVNTGAVIAEALAVAHAQGIVHRDIKPANIFVQSGGGIKITDFGIARVSDSTLTQEGTLIGTPHYMSPEQFMGQRVDGRSDLFSTAVILYEMFTGEKPFTGEAISTVMHQCIKVDPIPPEELNFSVPKSLGRVVMKAMSKRADERYADGHALAAALRESIKPNPDLKILGFDSAARAAADTVIAPSLDLGATMPSSTPPPGVMAVEGQPPSPAPATGLVRRRNALIGALVAAAGLMMAVIATWAFLSRPLAGDATEDKGISPLVTPVQETARIPVEVFLTQDLNAYLQVDSAMFARGASTDLANDPLHGTITQLEQSGSIVRVAGASVSVLDAEDNTPLGEAVTDSEGQCSLSLQAAPPNLVFVVRYGALERKVEVQGAIHWKRAQYFVLRDQNS